MGLSSTVQRTFLRKQDTLGGDTAYEAESVKVCCTITAAAD